MECPSVDIRIEYENKTNSAIEYTAGLFRLELHIPHYLLLRVSEFIVKYIGSLVVVSDLIH